MVTAHGSYFFFFQAEDGIRDYKVTGVQTCALPISKPDYREEVAGLHRALRKEVRDTMGPWEGILDAIQEFMPEDAILVRDVTVPATTWGSRLIIRRSPRTTLHASAGGIGQGLPMAIGAQIAAPSKEVGLLAGGRGLTANIGGLAAA